MTIWNQKDSAKANRYIWAPEIHKIGGSWYILFTAARNGGVWDIRPHMLKCMGDDPMNPANWKTADESNLHQVQAAAGDSFAFTNFSLDMTYFESAGKHYVSWAEKPGGISNIYLAEIDPSEPWKLTSKAVLMSTPDFAWEWSGGTIINEGPAVLKHDGKVFLCFSAAAVDYTYCVGMLSADEGADLTDIASWTKYPTPLLSSEDFADQCGPGHNSFTYDENDNPVIVYHARPYSCSNAVDANGNFGNCGFVSPGRDALNDPCRHARVKSLNFAADGTPILNMTADEELTKENRSVTMKVVVKEKEEPIKLPFTDVDENAWYHEYVEYVFVNNIMTGLTDTIFGIDDKLSRAQFATTLYRIEGKPAVTYTEKFKDVPDGLFYTDPVMWASAEGVNVISGYENGNFGPDDKLTREQMAVMLYRYVKYLGYEDLELADFSKFPDADKVSPFAKEAMQWAVAAQIITGDGGNLNPQGDSSRAVCATILTRFMKYTEEIK